MTSFPKGQMDAGYDVDDEEDDDNDDDDVIKWTVTTTVRQDHYN